MNTQYDAHCWVRRQLKHKIRMRPSGLFFKPTTADLRKLLKAPTTPRYVRNYLYNCLLYRRHWKVS